MKVFLSWLLLCATSASIASTLKVAWVDYPPFVYCSSEAKGGTLVMRVRGVLEKAGLPYTEGCYSLKRIVKELEDSKIDLVISNSMVIPETKLVFGTKLVQVFELGLLTKDGFKFKHKKLEVLRSVGILSQHHYMGFDLRVPEASRHYPPTDEAAIEMLMRDRLEGFLVYRGRYEDALAKVLSSQSDQALLNTSFHSLSKLNTYFAVRKTMHNANSILAQLENHL